VAALGSTPCARSFLFRAVGQKGSLITGLEV